MLFNSIALLITAAIQGVPGSTEAVLPDVLIAAPSDEVVLETGFPITIRIEEQLGSKLSETGQTFKLSLAEPIMHGDHILIPAGATGTGQVVHAKKGGYAGSAGELILAARYLEHNGRQIRLRSMKFAETGRDNTGTAMAVGIAAGVVGFLVSGGNTIVEPGTTANAKFAANTTLKIEPQETGPSSSIEGPIGSEVNE